MFYDALATTIEGAGRNQLDDCSRQVSRALGAGTLTDDQAQQLYELVQRRRGPPLGGRSRPAPTSAMVPRYYIKRSA